MAEVKTSPVRATHVVAGSIIDLGQPPGSFKFYTKSETRDQLRGMTFVCPCGCGVTGALPFHPLSGDDIKYQRDGWKWDGNVDAPTLEPSVHNRGHWHGWLRAGVWESA